MSQNEIYCQVQHFLFTVGCVLILSQFSEKEVTIYNVVLESSKVQ